MSVHSNQPSLFGTLLPRLLGNRELINTALVTNLLQINYYRPETFSMVPMVPRAIYNYPEELRSLLGSIPYEDRLKVVTDRDAYGNRALHRAALVRKAGAFRTILSEFPEDDQWKMLACTNHDNCTPLGYLFSGDCNGYENEDIGLLVMEVVLNMRHAESYKRWLHLASHGGFYETLLHGVVYNPILFKRTLESFQRDDGVHLLSVRSGLLGSMTVLHKACKWGATDTVTYILDFLDHDKMYEQIKTKTGFQGETALHCALSDKNKVKAILDRLTEDEKTSVISIRDSLGQTVFHRLIQVLDIDLATFRLLMNSTLPNERYTIMRYEDNCRKTVLLLAAEACYKFQSMKDNMVGTFLSYFSESEAAELLTAQDNRRNTPFHMVIQRHNSKAIADILGSITEESWKSLLVLRGNLQQTPLHIAIESRVLESVQAILTTCTDDEKRKLLLMQDKNGRSPLQQCTANKIFRYVLSQLPTAICNEIIGSSYTNYQCTGNLLHHAVRQTDLVKTNIILDLVSGDQMAWLTRVNKEGKTPLDLINVRFCSSIRFLLLDKCKLNFASELLPTQDCFDKKFYPRSGGPELLDVILKQVSTEEDCLRIMKDILDPRSGADNSNDLRFDPYFLLFLLCAIETYQKHSRSPICQLSLIGEKGCGLEAMINEIFRTSYHPTIGAPPMPITLKNRTLELLCQIRTDVKLNIVNSSSDTPGKLQWIENIVELEPLTTDQIQQLSPHSKRYVIPHHTENSKRYALILFCAASRQGAVEEADNLEQALAAVGCDVIKMEWSSTDELRNMIDSSIGGFANCSLLFVCIMSHGHRGTLSGGDNSEVPVNDILHQLTNSFPEYLPMILLVQACQGFVIPGMQPDDYSSESDPATPSHTIDPHNNKHIVLRRPHTALLLATVTGGLAIRGAFTGAVADELLQSDGRTELHSMFTHAVNRMSITDPDQTPEFRSTLKKALVLPPIINNAATIPQT